MVDMKVTIKKNILNFLSHNKTYVLIVSLLLNTIGY